MKKITRIVVMVLLLTLSATFTYGCSNSKTGNSTKGRYINEEYDLPEGIEYISCIKVLEDNSIAIIGNDEKGELHYLNSKDGGKSWEKKEVKFPTAGEGEEFISNTSTINSKGEIFLTYTVLSQEQLKAIEGIDPEKQSEEEIDEIFTNKHKLIKINNNEIQELNYEGDLKSAGDMSSDSHGNLFINDYDKQTIIQIDSTTGKVKKEFKLGEESYINGYTILGKSLIVNNMENLIEFNIDTGKKVGKVKGFKAKNVDGLFSDNDKTLYYRTLKGLYKFEIGENKSEKIIDSSLSVLGDSNLYSSEIIKINTTDFLGAFSNSDGEQKLISFRYDKKVSSIPKNKLTLYSLYENEEIRQAIVLYQKQHDNVYIEYKPAISFDEDMTKVNESDIIKALNTEIMAGKGPDIIILDGLPGKSYKNKELLEDISEIVDKNKDSLFEKITKAYTEKDAIYSYPLKINVPVISGRNLGDVKDLKSFKEVIEKEDTNSGRLLNVYKPLELVNLLYNSCGESWINDDKTINEENLKEFLESTKKIYEIVDKTNTDADKKKHNDEIKEASKYISEEIFNRYSYLEKSDCVYNIIPKDGPKYDFGMLMQKNEIAILESVGNEKYNIKYNTWSGQVGNYFIPKLEVAITAKSKNKDIAKDFVASLFEEEFQTANSYNGFPTNKKFCKDMLSNEEESAGSVSFSEEDGQEPITIDLGKVSEESVNKLIGTLDTLDKPMSTDARILDKVSKEMESYILGKTSLEDTIKTIKNKLEIYLSE